MAIQNNGLDATVTPSYVNAAAQLRQNPIVWGGGTVNFDDLTEDGTIVSFGTSSTSNTLQIFKESAGATTGPNSMVVQLIDGTGALAVHRTPAQSVSLNQWHRHIWALEIIDAATVQFHVWFDGVLITTTPYLRPYANNGSFGFSTTIVLMQSSTSSNPASHRRLNGTIEDVFVATGALPTNLEITQLQTGSARKALADSNSVIAFYPDLLKRNMRDRVTGIVASVGGNYPVATVRKDFDYGRNPTLVLFGDPQRNDATMWGVIRDKMLDYVEPLNLVVVNCAGDFTQTNIDSGFKNARNAFDAWQAVGLPTYGPPGNHDTTQTGLADRDMVVMRDPTNLPETFFYGMAGFDEAMTDTTRNDPPYDMDFYVYSALIGTDFLYINLPIWLENDHYDWIVQKAAQYPDRKVIIGAHAFLNSSGNLHTRFDDGGGEPNQFAPNKYGARIALGPNPGADPGDDPTSGYWLTHLSHIPNLVLITGGHDVYKFREVQTANQVLIGRNGNQVLALFCNNQEEQDENGIRTGGRGFSQMIELNDDSLEAFSLYVSTGELYGDDAPIPTPTPSGEHGTDAEFTFAASLSAAEPSTPTPSEPDMLQAEFEVVFRTESEEFRVNPTIAAADFRISKDGGALAPLTNTPVVIAGSPFATVTLTEAEQDCDRLVLFASDVTTPKDWADSTLTLVAESAITGTGSAHTAQDVADLIEREDGPLRAAATAAASAATATEDGVDLSDDAVDAIVVAAGSGSGGTPATGDGAQVIIDGVKSALLGTSETPDRENSPLLSQIEREDGKLAGVATEVEKIERSENPVEAGGIVAKRLYESDGTTIATNADGSQAVIREQTV